MKGLTDIQGRILELLKANTGNHGYPTYGQGNRGAV